VQGGQTQVTGFGEGEGVLHGFLGADLADEDDVGRLAQGVFQGFFIRTVSTPTSRWLTMDFLCGWTNSTGSSMVMM